MKSWPVQNAKAHFSELLNACVSEGPQVVTRHGTEAAVLVSLTEWQRLNKAARPSLKELLMSDAGRTDFDLPVRS
jgi:prevent-host-death family protein